METQDIKNTAAVTEETAVENNTAEKKDTQVDGSHFEHVKETLDLLYKYFPKAFIKEGNCRPLKIGIFDDLKAAVAEHEGLSISKVRAALRLYTTRLRYLFSLKEGTARVDLNGNEVEIVTAEHAKFAKERFKEINDKRKANRPAPQNAGKNEKKNSHKKPFAAKRPRPNKINGTKPEIADLKKGRQVLVLSGERHFVRGTVAEDAVRDTVFVTLLTGMTISCKIDRVLLPAANK